MRAQEKAFYSFVIIMEPEEQTGIQLSDYLNEDNIKLPDERIKELVTEILSEEAGES